MSKYVFEVDDTIVDGRVEELLKRMDDEGGVYVASPSWDIEITLVGKVVAEDSPGDQKIMAVEPLEG